MPCSLVNGDNLVEEPTVCIFRVDYEMEMEASHFFGSFFPLKYTASYPKRPQF